MKISNVEKRMTSGGANTPRIDLKEVIEIADAEKYEFDALNERLELLQDAWLKQREPGETFDSWFKRTPREEIIRITLSSGGKVIKFSDYKKPKGVKTINLSDYFDLGRRLIDLSQSERDTLKWILNKSLNPKK
jgi:hypothetical protein|tara:strand:+ start:7315 stop:7716 length:402 start_codon:yes stop_codon:yes gene_type:complete